MHDWKKKKERKKQRASHTPGKQKVLSCQATMLDRYFASRERSYKHPAYGQLWAGKIKVGNSRIEFKSAVR